jgi:hypothetical protein
MQVFISWSAERIKAVASALAELLPDALQGVKTWMSDRDIHAGERWLPVLGTELEKCNFGIICLTAENINSPWLLFEAGALAKSVSLARVVPFCLDLSPADVPYVFAQFQAVQASEEGASKLLQSINMAQEDKLSVDRITRVFNRWWPDLDKRLKEIPKQNKSTSVRRDDRALLEEILQHVRSLTPQDPFDRLIAMLADDNSFRKLHEMLAYSLWSKDALHQPAKDHAKYWYDAERKLLELRELFNAGRTLRSYESNNEA